MHSFTESSRLRSHHLEIAVRGNNIVISYEPPVALTLGSALRGRDIRSRVKTLLKRARPLTQSDEYGISASFSYDAADVLQGIIRKVDLMLDAYGRERLTSKMVEEILGITPAERRRWYKDRRLSHSGTASHGKGHQAFNLPLYAPDYIRSLAANPSIVAQWRKEDAARSISPQQSSAVKKLAPTIHK